MFFVFCFCFGVVIGYFIARRRIKNDNVLAWEIVEKYRIQTKEMVERLSNIEKQILYEGDFYEKKG